MVVAVDQITDVVQISCDFSKLNYPLVVTECLQNIAGFFGNSGYMGITMLRKAECL